MFWDIQKKQNVIKGSNLDFYASKYYYPSNKVLANFNYNLKPLNKVKAIEWVSRGETNTYLKSRENLGPISIHYNWFFLTIEFSSNSHYLLLLLFILESYSLNRNHAVFKNTLYTDKQLNTLINLNQNRKPEFFINKTLYKIGDLSNKHLLGSTQFDYSSGIKSFDHIEISFQTDLKNFLYLYNKKLIIHEGV